MSEDTINHMIVIPNTIEKQDIQVAARIMSRNAENQLVRTWIHAYNDKNLERLPLSVGDYFYGYHPKSWLVPFDPEVTP